MNSKENKIIAYPKPVIPLSPVFSGQLFSTSTVKNNVDSILRCDYVLHLSNGRSAIAVALEDAGVSKGDEVLVPAYHSLSMVHPIEWTQATPVFYNIFSDTNIDLKDIINKKTSNTKAIIITHYFGFMQDLSKIKEFCSGNNIILIEDCAHTFFGSHNGQCIGSQGDYSIASSMKFFACYDGGVLASSSKNLSKIKLSPPPCTFEIKSLFSIIEKSIHYKRLKKFNKTAEIIVNLKEQVWRLIKPFIYKKSGLAATPAASDGGYGLEENWIHKKATRSSASIIKRTNHLELIKARRNNYSTLHRELASLTNAHPLFGALDSETVPFLYPLYVNNPGESFFILKSKGVPIWRFGEELSPEITKDNFPDSVALSQHVFQFPCHQDLTPQELSWMIIEIKKAIQ